MVAAAIAMGWCVWFYFRNIGGTQDPAKMKPPQKGKLGRSLPKSSSDPQSVGNAAVSGSNQLPNPSGVPFRAEPDADPSRSAAAAASPPGRLQTNPITGAPYDPALQTEEPRPTAPATLKSSEPTQADLQVNLVTGATSARPQREAPKSSTRRIETPAVPPDTKKKD